MRRFLPWVLMVAGGVLTSSAGRAAIQDIAYATSVPAVTGWNDESRSVGSPAGKSCTGGANGGASEQPANYNPTTNNTYWLEGTGFTALASHTDMHITLVQVDADATTGEVTSGTINLHLAISGTNVTTRTVTRSWRGATRTCNWMSTKSGQA